MTHEDQLRQEIFHLGYRLHWGHDELMALAIDDRRAYVRLLIEALERETEAMREARGK